MELLNFKSDPVTLDVQLGLRVEEIEFDLHQRAFELAPEGSHHTWGQILHQGNQTWVGLHPQTILTPYSELEEICELLRPQNDQVVVDLGAGYGRLGFVLHQLYPQARFLGIEYVAERVEEGQRVLWEQSCFQSELVEGDLSAEDFEIPAADFYFIYDYGNISHMRRTLEQLKDRSLSDSFKVVARGRGIRSLIHQEHPWLADVFTPIHKENYSVYSMCSEDTSLTTSGSLES